MYILGLLRILNEPIYVMGSEHCLEYSKCSLHISSGEDESRDGDDEDNDRNWCRRLGNCKQSSKAA